MIRRLLVVFAIALLAASCSSADRLATVNGEDITKDELLALRPSYEEAEFVSAETIRSDLTLLIILEAVSDAAREQFGFEVAEAQIAERTVNPPSRYEALIGPPERFTDVTAEAIRASVIQTLVRDVVVANLAEIDAGNWDALIAERPEDITRSCVRHISVGSEDEADVVLARLADGEDFATLAGEVSLDQQSPGGLLATATGDCLVWLKRAGLEFARLAATAPLRTAVGPVAANGEYNILFVEERLAPASVAELASDPMEWLDPDLISSLYTPWFNAVVKATDIDISPTVGRWSEDGLGIAPPGQ